MAASAIAPISYICLVSGLVAVGASLNLVGQFLITPFALKNKAWDMVVLSVFFGTVNLIALAPHVAKAFGPDASAPSNLERVDRAVHAPGELEGLHE